jgi:DNA-binding XRE family transcriptional regulator
MDHQDWTTVTLRRRTSAKDAHVKGQTVAEARDTDRSEKSRMAKLDTMDGTEIPRKRVQPESIQALIRKRIELGLNQEKADQKCSFPRHTFKTIESNHHVPTTSQQSAIQKHFGIQLKVEIYQSS